MEKDKYERVIKMVDNIKYFWNETDIILLSHTLSDYDFIDCCADSDDDQDYKSSIYITCKIWKRQQRSSLNDLLFVQPKVGLCFIKKRHPPN